MVLDECDDVSSASKSKALLSAGLFAATSGEGPSPRLGDPRLLSFVAMGNINGDGLVSVDTFPNPAELGFSKAHTVIHTDKGDLRCGTEAALFDLAGADHAFVDLCFGGA